MEYAHISINDAIPQAMQNKLKSCFNNISSVCSDNICTYSSDFSKIKCLDGNNDELCNKISKKDLSNVLKSINSDRSPDLPAIKASDVKFERECYYPFACVRGDLHYKTATGRDSQFKFKTYVSLGKPGSSAPMPPSYTYDLFFEAGKDNHTIRLPLAQEIKPGSTDHFLIKISSDKSSNTDMTIELIDTENETLSRTDINLETLISKSGLAWVNRE